MLVVNVPGDGDVNVRDVDDDRVHDEDEDDMQEEEEEGGNIVHDGDDDASCDVDDDDVDEDDNRTFHSYYLRKDERQHRPMRYVHYHWSLTLDHHYHLRQQQTRMVVRVV